MADLFAAARARAAAIAPSISAPAEPISDFSTFSRATSADCTVSLALTPMPHQNVVINAVAGGHRRLLVADEMGVGKTLSAIGAVEAVNAFPALFIVPPSLTRNWQREVERALPGRTVQVLSGTKPGPIAPADVTIIGDAVIAAWSLPAKKGEPDGPLATYPWAALVVDEAHRMKGLADSKPSKRARAAALISQRIAPEAVRLALTGTPILNRPREIIGALTISGTLHRIARTKGEFLYRYCGPQNNGWGVSYSGASNVAELNAKLTASCMIRRLRSEVLTLPNKGRSLAYLPVSDAAARDYRKAQADLESFLRNAKGDKDYSLAERAHAIVLLNTLRRISGIGKVEAVVAQAQDLLDEGEQVFIAAHHIEVVARISTALASHGVVEIVGGMSADEKQASVDAFQSGRARVLVGNIDAAGVGFTLTSGRHIIVAELPWTPGALQQVEDRLHRIGQTREVISTITISDLPGGSVDERLWRLLDSKAQVIGAVLDGDSVGLDTDIQKALLDSYR